ncbi:hypothetical protein HYPSUDRAFT_578139 [Hypholoma sublateritium FD-334 SS-4]|uniref:F-box domain-containing protein n=1 Tax=Hypholoma sublateritium (strain FD-334 SS-4) TaxID=945553 RepID=A0A0D2PVC3_HYPSF|nr:hypothetical protein HYPSUDRAFT_578139 [Hypholoma sublateritium FD-334 SS-4]
MNLSLLSLPEIANCCPKLRRLKIYVPPHTLVDDKVVSVMECILRACPGPHPIRTPTAGPHGLYELVFLRSSRPPNHQLPKPSMQHGVVVAEYLNFLFPKLGKVDFREVTPLLGEDWCYSVSSILARFKRRNETK